MSEIKSKLQLFVLSEDEVEKLRAICFTLHSGSDKMRDQGHKLWLIIDNFQSFDYDKLEITE